MASRQPVRREISSASTALAPPITKTKPKLTMDATILVVGNISGAAAYKTNAAASEARITAI